MVARGRDGATAAFPVTETVHQNSICWVTETPAAVPPAVAAAAAELAQRAVQSLPGALGWCSCSRNRTLHTKSRVEYMSTKSRE